MEWWIWVPIAVAIVALVWLAQRAGWIDLSDKTKRGGGSGGVLMIGDEVFAPRKHEAQAELDKQARLPVPAPLPGDGDKGIAFAADDPDDSDVPGTGADASRRAPARTDRFRGTIRLDVERD
ncbi:hypothetical protein ET445_02550 [Agromyces protaetiae]|uniref:Uncharacterized protein n=1 Tax=Agromyces protaetiae TaxID=2509455 RepID=A0A4V0YGU0_9MICO|nr:hypothetical protein [Agromyces protaetiae]QAY72381.1 hypothetical protein ET445_02550 [Agromyces protaetiae]